MFKLFKRLSEKKKKLSAENTKETKKCMYCLKRVSVSVSKCPHCRREDFDY